MNPKTKKTFDVMLMITLSVSLVLTVFRSALLFTSYDAQIGYYERGDMLHVVLGFILAVCVLGLLVFALVWRKKTVDEPSSRGIPLMFGSGVFGVCSLAYAATLIRSISTGSLEGFSMLFSLLAAIAALIACVYFIVNTLEKKPGEKNLALLSMCICIFMMCCAFSFYFDFSTAMNSPAKSLSIVTMISLMLFFLYETRLNFKIPLWSLYISSGFMAIMFCMVYSVPNIVYYVVTGNDVIGSAIHDLLMFSSLLYILARMLLISDAFLPKNDSSVMDALSNSGNAEPDSSDVSEADPQQKSFFDDNASGEDNDTTVSPEMFDRDTSSEHQPSGAPVEPMANESDTGKTRRTE